MKSIKSWNKVVECLDELQKAWAKHRRNYEEERLGMELEKEALQAQIYLGSSLSMCEFDYAMELFVNMWMNEGRDFMGMLIPEEEDIKETIELGVKDKDNIKIKKKGR